MSQNDETVNKPAPNGPAQERPEAEAKPGDYIKLVRASLRSNKDKEAFSIIQKAIVHFPEDPFTVSYHGYLQAYVDKKYRTGVETCKKAIALLTASETTGKNGLYPTLYLNLGRAYVEAEKRKDAVEAFRQGLKYDKWNSDIHNALKMLGQRKSLPIPFLDRSNPINILIGTIMHKLKKRSAGSALF